MKAEPDWGTKSGNQKGTAGGIKDQDVARWIEDPGGARHIQMIVDSGGAKSIKDIKHIMPTKRERLRVLQCIKKVFRALHIHTDLCS